MSEESPKLNLMEMAITFVSPALVGKLLIVYFGSMYSAHPGQGYGVALSVSILFTLTMIGRFLWKYRNYAEEEI